MELPIGKIKKDEIERLFTESIEYHIAFFYKTLEEYEPLQLYSHWRSIVRSIDEIINIPFELSDIEEKKLFLGLDFNFLDPKNCLDLKVVSEILEKRFEQNVATRFMQLAMMCMAIDKAYESQNLFDQQGNGLRLNNTVNAIRYLQSRRVYYVTTLGLIPKIAKGKKTIKYIDTLNFLHYPMDSCLVGVTTAYYNLLLNNCLPDFEMVSDGKTAKGNFRYDHLETFFLEPERLSLIDQLELRRDVVVEKKKMSKRDNAIFSFVEVTNAMSWFESAFDKYKIQENVEYRELSSLFDEITIYLEDDFHVVIKEAAFTRITGEYTHLELYLESEEYFQNLNSYSPFQKVSGFYFTTVVLLTRFVYRTLSQSLMKNKTFQIHSGFIFEDKVLEILQSKGYLPTHITRINRQEFDLITIKGGKVFNFQCKNNYIDISRVSHNYKKIGRFNRRLCKYYEAALVKEEKRENLIKEKTGFNDVEHFVISRFPVITKNKKIINFINMKTEL